MNIYQNNAFRVLGLLTNATTKDVVSRAEEIKAKKSVDVHDVYDYDFPWLGTLDRSEENISSAVQRLEDPVRRIKQELSWFWVQSKNDNDALSWMTRNRPKSAVDIWLKASGISLSDLNQKDFNPPVTVESLTALHNLFVLLQSVLLRNELIADKNAEPILLLDNTEGTEKDWAVTLKIFNFLHDNPKFWELVQKRIAAMQDRRLQNISLDEIKESALNNALSAHFYLITRALEKRDLNLLDKHIEILEKADMPAELYKSGLNQILNSRIAHMNSLIDDMNRDRKAMDDKGDSALLKSLFYKYRDSGKSLIEDCKVIDRKGMTDFVLSQEKFAKSLHQLSWKLNKTGDSVGALEAMNEAYKNLKSDALRLECTNDAANIFKDAVAQYGSEATWRIHNNTIGLSSVEDLLGIKIQYLEKIDNLFSAGKELMTGTLQGSLRNMVAAELKVISQEARDKYQQKELADSILKEAAEWSSGAPSGKKENFKKGLDKVRMPQALPTTTQTAAPRQSFAWTVALIIVVAALVGVRKTAVVPPVIPPAAKNTSMSSPQEPAKASAEGATLSQSAAHGAIALGTLSEIADSRTFDRNNPNENILLEQAAAMRQSIEIHKEKIKTMEEELTIRSRESQVRQASIDRLNNKIGSDPDNPEYNFWVGEHNELVREQNQSVELSKELYQKYQDEFKVHQDMINSYNEKFAR